MRGLDLAGVGGVLLLVLPVLSVVAVLLTAPVARLIGRHSHEEDRVVRAPLAMAIVAVAVQAVVAFALSRSSQLHLGMPLVLGPLGFEVTHASVAGVLSLSALLLVLLVSSELSRATPGVLAPQELASSLGVWAVHCLVSCHGDMRTILVGVWLIGSAVSLVLVVEALKHARTPRLWLLSWAVLVPGVVFILLWPLRAWQFGADWVDTRAFLRTSGPAAATSLLLRLWLSTGFGAIAGLIAFANIPRARIHGPQVPVLLGGSAVTVALPAVARLTEAVLPSGVDAAAHLGPALRAIWVFGGIVLLAGTLLKLPALRRLCLFCAGWVCAVGWAMAMGQGRLSLAAVAPPTFASLALPWCFVAAYALAASRVTASSAPSSLPLTAIALFPATGALGGPWIAAVQSGGPIAVLLPGVLLSVGVAVAAVAGVALPLLAERRDGLLYGLFPLSQTTAGRRRVLAELVIIASWLLLCALTLACWSGAA